jgi:23S rRNA pseudouridine1911/1915/1917 synthase
VCVDGQVVNRPSTMIRVGSRIEVEIPPPRPALALPQDLPLRIVYEDSDLAVIDKASGMVVHPSAGHADGTLVNAILHHIGDLSGIGGVERPGIVHRLDKGTSGLLVVAKNDAAHQSLAAQFAAHSAGRRYLALVMGAPVLGRGTVTTHLARHPTKRRKWASTDDDSGKRAVTHWRVLQRAGTVSLLACELETGRTHQVRVHLSESGWPIVGDPLYRRRGRVLPATLRGHVADDRPLLHARNLRLEHPSSGELLAFEAEIPADFAEALHRLGIRP